MKKIMILGASILQLPAIEKALEMGLQVVAADMNPDAIGFRTQGVKRRIVSTIDTDGILQAAREERIDGIMTLASDMPMMSVATVCQALGLVGVSVDTAMKATNKGVMRDALRAAGVPVPMFFRVSDREAFEMAVRKLRAAGHRCIVKPTDNSGSRGVNLLSTDSDLDEAFEYTTQFARGGELVVEEFMEGPEVSVETLALDGEVHVLQITDKLTTGAPYFVEMGHSQPSLLDGQTRRRIAEVAVAANRAIGIENGPSHTEIKVTRDGPKIVELGARLGGDCITTHLVPLSTGIDMVKCSIQIALGDRPDLSQREQRGSAIRYLKTGTGRVSQIQGLDEALAVDHVKQVVIVHGVGDIVGRIRSSNDRAGFVIAQADSAQDAIASCERAVEKVRVILET